MSVHVSDWVDAPGLQPAGREFAIGDVHGFSKPLEIVLRAMGERAAATGHGHLTILGDLIDRGPDHLGALKLAVQPADAWGFSGKTLLIGNHDLFLALLLGEGHYDTSAIARTWLMNGGHGLLDQLGVVLSEDIQPHLVDCLGNDGVAQIKGMSGSRVSGNVRMSHAGPGWFYGIAAKEWYAAPTLFTGFLHGSLRHYTWTREWWTQPPLDDGFFVHGHTPEIFIREIQEWNPEVHRLDGPRLGLDGGGFEQDERHVVGAELEPGRYRIYAAR